MTAHIRDRGPDAWGLWRSTDGAWSGGRGEETGDLTPEDTATSADDVLLYLGHRRLSIIDLSENGAQPMVSRDGRYVIVYNGEIYNADKLRAQLLSEGHVPAFRGSSDTEVLLEAVAAYGLTQTLQRCRGMFAIGIYDRQTHLLQLARDRVGEKPLYYGFTADRRYFAFASDVGCFPEISGFDNEINREALPLYFIHGYIPAPYTIYRNIWKLPPGTILTLQLPVSGFDVRMDPDIPVRDETPVLTDGHAFHRYWSMQETALAGQRDPFRGTRAEAAQELERLLSESIRGQMVADVPLGAFLSAGIDSSTVVSLMQAQAPGRVRTFTIGMEAAGYNEADAAREIAKHLDTEHTELIISEADAMGVIPQLAGIFGEPFADSSQIPTYLVSRMTREHVTVSLSGDGGDELFCGYTSYASIDRIWHKLQHIPHGLRRTASTLALHSPFLRSEMQRNKAYLLSARGPRDLHRLEQQTDPVSRQLVQGVDFEALPYVMSTLPEFCLEDCKREVMLADMLLYHPDDILVKVDRAAMAVSLETRVPMLDADVVAFAWTLPMSYLKSDGTDPADGPAGTGKLVLRDILYRHVPRALMDRPKKGFSIPIDAWLRTPALRDWAGDLLSPVRIRDEGLLDAAKVAGIYDDFTGRGQWRIQLWYLLMFEQWMQETARGRRPIAQAGQNH